MSLESFAPPDVSEIEMAVFPWDRRHCGLTGIGALFWLPVVSTEPYGDCDISNAYMPLNSVMVNEVQERDKYGKKKNSTKKQYTSTLTGNSRGSKPSSGTVLTYEQNTSLIGVEDVQQFEDEDIYDIVDA